MALGNGDIAGGVYVSEDGDLYLFLWKNDAFTHNGDLFKTGRVRISLEPNPFAAGKPFKQTLDLNTGSIRIAVDGVEALIWADANKPVYPDEMEYCVVVMSGEIESEKCPPVEGIPEQIQ